MAGDESPQSSIILYSTEDGRTRIECRFENESIWLTQRLIAELFQIGVNTVNYHLKEIYDEAELERDSTIRSYRIVQMEGARQISRDVEHYSLPAILAVGYRVRSPRGTQFRQWATARLSEYLVKGFTMDDQRLRSPPGPGVPDECLILSHDQGRRSNGRLTYHFKKALATDGAQIRTAKMIFIRVHLCPISGKLVF